MAKKSKKEEEKTVEIEKQNEVKNEEKPNDKKTKEKPQKKKKEKKKKGFLASFIRWIIFILIVAALSAFAIYSLPINPEIQSKKLETKTGKIDDIVEIKCNQYIKKVYYSVNPTKKDDLAYYEEAKLTKGGFNAKVDLESINLMPGKGNIYFIIQGLFTKSEPISIKYKFDIGYLAEFNEGNLESIKGEDGSNTGLYTIKNRLNIYFKESASDKKIKDLIEEYDGEIVGVNYLLCKYTVEFNSSDLDDLI